MPIEVLNLDLNGWSKSFLKFKISKQILGIRLKYCKRKIKFDGEA